MNSNRIGLVLVTLLLLLVASVSVMAQTTDALTVYELEINRMDGLDSKIITIERGEDIDIDVTVLAGLNDVENVQIEAFIAGYRYAEYERDLVTDYTKTFDLTAENKRSFGLKLQVPVDMDKKDAKLRIIIADENSDNVIQFNYQLNIEGSSDDNAVDIRKFLISPSEEIEAGRALSFKVQVKNVGNSDLDDVTVRVAIPELGVQAYETIDELESNDGDGEVQSFEALLVRIPSNAKAGTYDVVATVEFDKYRSVEMTKEITVIAAEDTSDNNEASGKTLVMMPDSIELSKGTSGAIYPILIENQGDASRTYVVSVSGTSDWATTSFEPSSVVIVKGGDSKSVYLKLNPHDDAKPGDRVFQVSILSGEESKETSVVATLNGDVVEEDEDSSSSVPLRTVLEWALIILIIVLIILGLILVFVKMRKNDRDDNDDEAQTYY